MNGGSRTPTAVLVTRPGDAGEQLTGGLRAAGAEALWWPAFDLLGPEDPEALRSVARDIARFDLVIFVSPAAVRGWTELRLCGAWPASTAIAAVGAASLDLARRLVPGAAHARLIGPPDAEGAGSASGSEALWIRLRELQPPPACVLIVRAESGREWLAERLQEAGAQVEYASVYRRREHAPDDAQRATLQSWFDRGWEAASLVTSSEAVGVIDRQLDERAPLRQWLRAGLALCTHERIGDALRAAGYAHVAQCEPSARSILSALAAAKLAGEGGR